LKFGGEKRLKSGKADRSTVGRYWLKSRSEMLPKFGSEFAVAAPMTTRAASDTAITGTAFETTCGSASGGLPVCVFLPCASLTLRILHLSPVAGLPPRRPAQQKSRRGDEPTMVHARLPTRTQPK
jgi:hypothetical protein